MKGYLRLNVATNASVSTKSGEVYDPKQIAVKIVNAQGVVVEQTDDWEIWGDKNFELPTGAYTIQASSNGFDGQTAAFDKPYYAGSQKIMIEKGKSIMAEVICTLANVKVSVSFSESFRNAFKAATVQIGSAEEGATALSFLMSDNLANKFAYFPAKPLTWSITVQNKNGVSKTTGATINKVEPRDYFKFHFTLTPSSNITISIDETTKDYNYTIGIPTTVPEFRVTTSGKVNAWSRFAQIGGQVFSQKDINPEMFLLAYKKASEGSEAWSAIKPSITNPVANTYAATAQINGLSPATEYEYALCYNDGTLAGYGDTLRFTTETEVLLYNGDFDIWSKPGKIWYAGTAGEANAKSAFWDSGNPGTSTMSKNATYPTTDIVHTPGGQSGVLQSQFVGVLTFGQFAAGNIYTGQFVKVIGSTGAEIQFGQPFKSRPTKLHGWFRYNPGTVDYVGPIPAGVSMKKEDTDINSIYIALSDKGSRYTVNTSSGSFINYETDPNIIAYGELPAADCVSTNGEWKEFTINLKYRDLSRKPTHIIICASASKYGDYFTGSTSSIMHIDDFELIYDGNPEMENK